jgi:hypothetical protein
MIKLQAKQYFAHLSTLGGNEPGVWLALSVCCAFAKDFQECQDAIHAASDMLDGRGDDVRVLFCKGTFR